MFVRCKHCHSSVWLQTKGAEANEARVDCEQCGQRYDLDFSEKQKRGKQFSRDARKLAKLHGVDLAGAHSVMLGMMSIEDVRELGREGSTACPTSDNARRGNNDGGNNARSKSFDPAFKPAVEAGFLSARQAAERGRRDACAGLIRSKHKLDEKTAYLVADNRMSLLEAMRHRSHRTEIPVHLGDKSRKLNPVFKVGAVLVLALVAVIFIARPQPDPEYKIAVQKTVGAAEVSIDMEGRPVQITGPTPQTILQAFCRVANPDRPLQPIEVVATASRSGDARLGLLRDPEDPASLLAITIHENREQNHWVVGDGTIALQPKPAPPGASRALSETDNSQPASGTAEPAKNDGAAP